MLKTTHMFIKKRMNKLVVIMQKNTNQQKKNRAITNTYNNRNKFYKYYPAVTKSNVVQLYYSI